MVEGFPNADADALVGILGAADAISPPVPEVCRCSRRRSGARDRGYLTVPYKINADSTAAAHRSRKTTFSEIRKERN